MGLFNFGKRSETFLAVVTSEGGTRLRLNGLRTPDAQSKKTALAHDRTVCWIEFSSAGGMVDKGIGKSSHQQVDRLLRELPTNPTCRAILDRLREGQDSVGKWLQLDEPAHR